MTVKIGSYWDDDTGLIWAECPRHGSIETQSEPVALAWMRLHDYCGDLRLPVTSEREETK